jgi:hypothetical protein
MKTILRFCGASLLLWACGGSAPPPAETPTVVTTTESERAPAWTRTLSATAGDYFVATGIAQDVLGDIDAGQLEAQQNAQMKLEKYLGQKVRTVVTTALETERKSIASGGDQASIKTTDKELDAISTAATKHTTRGVEFPEFYLDEKKGVLYVLARVRIEFLKEAIDAEASLSKAVKEAAWTEVANDVEKH